MQRSASHAGGLSRASPFPSPHSSFPTAFASPSSFSGAVHPYQIFSQGTPMMMMMQPMHGGNRVGVPPATTTAGNGSDVFLLPSSSSPLSPPVQAVQSIAGAATSFLSSSNPSYGRIGEGGRSVGNRLPAAVAPQRSGHHPPLSSPGSAFAGYNALGMKLPSPSPQPQPSLSSPSLMMLGGSTPVPMAFGNQRENAGVGGGYLPSHGLPLSSPRGQVMWSTPPSATTISPSSLSGPPSAAVATSLSPSSRMMMMMMSPPSGSPLPSPTPSQGMMMMMMSSREGVPTNGSSSPSSMPSYPVMSHPFSSFSGPLPSSFSYPDPSSPSVPPHAPPAFLAPPHVAPTPPLHSFSDEMSMLKNISYKASMLPPPLSLEMHQNIWKLNTHETAEKQNTQEEGVEERIAVHTNTHVSNDGNEKEDVVGSGGEDGKRHSTNEMGPHCIEAQAKEMKMESVTHLSEGHTQPECSETEVQNPEENKEGKEGGGESTPTQKSKEGKEEDHSEKRKGSHQLELSNKETNGSIMTDNSTLSTDATSPSARGIGEVEEEMTETVSISEGKAVLGPEAHTTPVGKGGNQKERLDASDSHTTVSSTSGVSPRSEGQEDKWRRLQAYKEILDRWFRHIQVLQERQEVTSAALGGTGGGRSSSTGNRQGVKPRARIPCKSYEDVLNQYRQSSNSPPSRTIRNCSEISTPKLGELISLSPGGSGSLTEATCSTATSSLLSVDEFEEVLQSWSNECMKWWQDTQKKKSRRIRKNKRTEDRSSSVGAGRSAGDGISAVAIAETEAELQKMPLRILGSTQGNAMVNAGESEIFSPSTVSTADERDEALFSYEGFFKTEGNRPMEHSGECDLPEEGASPRYPITTISDSSSDLQFDDDCCQNWGLTDAITSQLLQFDD